MPTRGRAAHAAACAEKILAAGGFVDLIFVDQSDDRATEEALSRIHDPRLRYVRTDTRGVTNGRNIAITLSQSDIVAFTDDDCRVRPDWVQRLTDVFTNDPEVAVVCGRVVVPDEIRLHGWAESFEPRTRVWCGRYPPIGEWGITANMALRRSMLTRVGLFDPMLGAGAPLRSGGEPDFLFRALRCGFRVVNAEEVVVDHLGIRKPGPESTKLIHGYGIGTAAAFLKHVRLGDATAARIYVQFLGSTASLVFRNLIRHGRPTGAGFLLALLRGAVESRKYAIDPERRWYVER